MMNTKFKGLGKGLSALMGDTNDFKSQESRDLNKVPIEFIKPNPDQPRKIFDKDSLKDLSLSIKAKGIIQPIIVRKKGENDYEIVAGERRWRAAQLANFHQVPIIVKDIDDKEAFEFAIIENIQRSDLNIIEEAEAYNLLINKFNYNQDQLAQILGKSRSHIANIIRLNLLPGEIKDMLKSNALSFGHARCLINIPDNIKIANEILKKNLSVRQTEKLVSQNSLGNNKRIDVDTNIKSFEKNIESSIGFKVEVKNKKNNSGTIKIYYKNLDQLNTIVNSLKKTKLNF